MWAALFCEIMRLIGIIELHPNELTIGKKQDIVIEVKKTSINKSIKAKKHKSKKERETA
jgi:hypothetical protein